MRNIIFPLFFILLIGCSRHPRDYSSIKSPRRNEIVLINAGNANRQELAAAINLIAVCKPKVIGVNFVFTSLGDKKSDSLLATAFKNAGNVILTAGNEGERLERSVPLFTSSVSYDGPSSLSWSDSTVVAQAPFRAIKNSVVWSFSVNIVGDFQAEAVSKLMENNNVDRYFKLMNSCQAEDFTLINIDSLSKTNPIEIENKIVLLGYLGPSAEDRYKDANGRNVYLTVVFANCTLDILDGRFEEYSE